MAKHVLKPWKDVCILRNEIKTKTLTTADFAVDLHRVIFHTDSGKKYTDHYTDPVDVYKRQVQLGRYPREFLTTP